MAADNGKIGVGWSVPAPIRSRERHQRLRRQSPGGGHLYLDRDHSERCGLPGHRPHRDQRHHLRGHGPRHKHRRHHRRRLGCFTRVSRDACGGTGWCSVTPAASTGTPGDPQSTSVTAGDTQLTVGWSAPATFTGPAVHAYSVRHKENSAADSTYDTHTVYADTTSLVIDGLTNSTAYKVQIRAENANGDSSWTTIGTTHTPTS